MAGKLWKELPEFAENSILLILNIQIDGLVQERHNSSANALELCLCCTNPLKCN